MKQKPGSHNCVAVVAAMITGNTPEDFESKFEKNIDGGYTDKDIFMYLLQNGYHAGTGANIGGHKVEKTINVEINVMDNPAYIVVKSETYKDCDHVIYWDGKRVWDPKPEVSDGRPLSDYFIKDWWLISKIEEYPKEPLKFIPKTNDKEMKDG